MVDSDTESLRFMTHSSVKYFYNGIVQSSYAMSNSSKTSRRTPTRKADAPLIGSLLRLPREHIVARVLAEFHRQGFDVPQPELGVFMFPGPDGRRPADLARQCHMSRQAMNYVLTELERRDYMERRAGPASAST